MDVRPGKAAVAAKDADARGPEARTALEKAAAGGTISTADRRNLERADVTKEQVEMLREAMKATSDGKRYLTYAEATAILRGRALPEARATSIVRLRNAVRDGKVTAKETGYLRKTGISTEQIAKLKLALRADSDGGRKVTSDEIRGVLGPKPAPDRGKPAPGRDGGQPGAPGLPAPVPGGAPTAPAGPTALDPAALPASAALSGTNADGYRLSSFPTSGGAGGQSDARGNLYVATGNEVRIFDKDNRAIQRVMLPFPAQDVAPSPDGSVLYAVEPVGDGSKVPRKFVRGGDGQYTLDTGFKLEQFDFGGAKHDAEGLRIATDAKGNLYVADGMWTKNDLQTVIKYDPNGKYVTRFGQYVDGNADDASSWEQGRFYWGLGGIAVSPDGNSVYTTEVGNNRVQRWDKGGDGSYAVGAMWGNTQQDDPNRKGSDRPGKFAAPYDIGVDAGGDVYVMNTTASQIQKFTREGQFVTSMYVGGNDPNVRNEAARAHGLAVSAAGDAISVETGRMMERA